MKSVKAGKQHIPKHLRKWVVDQQYHKYTPIDQAVWRYVMRQNHNFLKDVAHEAYIDGLKGSGIGIDAIPRVDEMTEALAPFGLSAVTIDGFIPAIAFFSFQAHGILPIASDIRMLKNILYTPAPDIIHEAAGHAPILCDEKYSRFVKRFGEIGSKAIATKEEHAVFEAAKSLSDMLETGLATEQDIAEAKRTFELKQQEVKIISEAEQLGRLYWWTVEFGMIGSLAQPKIFGAGLLSSVGESKNSLTDRVQKRPFDLETVINTGFNISEQQPHLFVCESFDQLLEAVETFAEGMAFMRGGTEGLQKAIDSGTTATVELSSGLQISGTFTNVIKNEANEAIYFNTTGATALAINDTELRGQGSARHQHGFGSPVGRLLGAAKDLEHFTDVDFFQYNIGEGEQAELRFESGITVCGKIKSILKQQHKIVLITFTDVRVSLGKQMLFKPEWGEYDMAVGATITSVFGGAADPERFFKDDIYKEDTVVRETEQVQLSRELTPLEKLYGQVRYIREADQLSNSSLQEIEEIIQKLKVDFPQDWLLRVELVELLSTHHCLPELQQELLCELEALRQESEDMDSLISNGLRLIALNERKDSFSGKASA